jgi:SAM-dependent methyltransferase
VRTVATGEDRAAIVDSARYLRSVRPLDPEELAQYVEGGTHPAVVARVLREEAFGLGVVERPDGTFVPVGDEPVAPGVGTVRRIPGRYVRRVEDRLVERYGPDWHRGASGDRLRERVRRLKEDYYRNRDVEYDAEVALGYAVYHLADFYAAVQYVLDGPAAAGLLGRRLRVLDVGAGVGGPALGLHDYLFGPPGRPDDAGDHEGGADDGDRRPATDRERDPTAALVDYHAVEPSAAADLLGDLLDETGPNFHATVHRTTAEAFDPWDPLDGADGDGSESGGGGGRSGGGDGSDDGDGAGWDLVLFANVLSELADPGAVARRYLDALAPSGSLVAMAPADRETAVGLRRVERSLEREGATVFAPEVRLWPDRRPADEGWSFVERPSLETPAVQRKLDPGGGEFVKRDVRYAYAVLRRDDATRIAYVPDRERFAPLGDSEDHVTDRVNVVGIKLSGDLSDDGHPLFRVGDGSQSVDHYAVLAKGTALNRALATAAYGDPLVFEGVLVLWNDDEGAYNLVVDEETVVDRVPVGPTP